MKQNKSIILCMPSDYGISETIVTALIQLGFTVYPFKYAYYDAKFKYKNIFQRLHNAFRKAIFKDFKYKETLKFNAYHKKLRSELKNTPDVDFALFIRPDLFQKKFIALAKRKARKTIGYQWDGLDRFPQVYEYIDFFDRFFVFDKKDVNLNKKLLPITNFYIPSEIVSKPSDKVIYFLATYDDYRFELMKKLKIVFTVENLPHKLIFITPNKENLQKLKEANFYLEDELSYSENLRRGQKASTIIDIHSPDHSGLSFRIFESLNYENKLITTNMSVKEYDFYHPNNIFIWDGTNENDIKNFLDLEYVSIEKVIKDKYSFNNWINYVLENDEYTAIELP